MEELRREREQSPLSKAHVSDSNKVRVRTRNLKTKLPCDGMNICLRLHFHFRQAGVERRSWEDAPEVDPAGMNPASNPRQVPIQSQKAGGRCYIVSIQRLEGGAEPGAALR